MGEAKTHYEVIVVGAGVAGIYQIKRLVDLGIDATVLDSAADLGGTWYWNRYPGCRFDSESYTYGFSFSRELLDEWHWKERFSVRRSIRRASSGRARVPMYKRRPPAARRRQTSEPSRWRFTTARAAPKSHDQEPCRGELSAITAAPSWHGPCPSTPLRLSCGIL